MRKPTTITDPSGEQYWLLEDTARLRWDLDRARALLRQAIEEDPGAGDTVRQVARSLGCGDAEIDAAIDAVAQAIASGALVPFAMPEPPRGRPVVRGGALTEDWSNLPLLSEMTDAPVVEPGWLSIEIVDDRGAPLGAIELTMVQCDGRRDRVVCDRTGRFLTRSVPPPGPVRLEWPPTLARTGAPAMAMDGFVVTADDIQLPRRPDGPTVLTRINRHHRFVVESVECAFDFEEVTFGNERAVLLPVTDSEHRVDRPDDVVRGLSAIAAVVEFARNNPTHALVLVGHADAVGGGSSAAAVALARAENVRRYLVGELDGWASHCMTVYAVEDVQRILAWVHATFAWDCDPGLSDNDLGPQTTAALLRFRTRHALTFGSTPSPDVAVDVGDWRAFANLYDLGLESILRADAPTPRGGFRWLQSESAIADADHPRRLVPGGVADGTDRRVELVFASPGTQAQLVGRDLLTAIHDARNPLRYIPLDPQRTLFVMKGQFFDPLVGTDVPLPRHRWALVYTDTVLLEGDASDADGVSTILEPDGQLPDGEFELRLVPIFEGQVGSDADVWIDVEARRWVTTDQIGDGSHRCIAAQKLLRVPQWSTRTKAERGGGFVAGLPNSGSFTTTGLIPSNELKPNGSRAAPWVMQIDHGWFRSHVQLTYYDPITRADRNIPQGILLMAKAGLLDVVGGSSVLLPGGAVYMLCAGVAPTFEKLYYQFELPEGTWFSYADGAMVIFPPAEALDYERFGTHYPLPSAWGGPTHDAWIGPGPPSRARRKRFAELRHDGATSEAPLCFHLDDMVFTTHRALFTERDGTPTLPSPRCCLLDNLMAIRSPFAREGHELPWSSMVVDSLPLRAEDAFYVRGQGSERMTRAIEYGGSIFTTIEHRVGGALGLSPFVGIRAAQYSKSVPLRDAELHLLDVRWLRYEHDGVAAKLAHLLVHVPCYVTAPEADDAEDGRNAARVLGVPRVERLLLDASRRWDQQHPAHARGGSPKKDYVIVSERGLTEEGTVVKVRHHFGASTRLQRVDGFGETSETSCLTIAVHPQAGRAHAGSKAREETSPLYSRADEHFDAYINLYLAHGPGIPSATDPHVAIPPAGVDFKFSFEPSEDFRLDEADGVRASDHTVAHELGHAMNLPDEYAEPLRTPQAYRASIPAFQALARPFNFDAYSMMRGNRLPRLRHQWMFAAQIERVASQSGASRHWPTQEGPFVVQYDSPSRQLRYALPSSVLDIEERSGYAKCHTSQLGDCDIFLFLVGEDESAYGPIIQENGFLPKPIDGAIVFSPKLWISFDGIVRRAHDRLDFLYENIARDFCDPARCPKFVLASPQANSLRRVLVLLQPRFELGSDPSKLWPGDDLEKRTAADFEVRVCRSTNPRIRKADAKPHVLMVHKRDVGRFLMRYTLDPTDAVFEARDNRKIQAQDLQPIQRWFENLVGRTTTMEAL